MDKKKHSSRIFNSQSSVTGFLPVGRNRSSAFGFEDTFDAAGSFPGSPFGGWTWSWMIKRITGSAAGPPIETPGWPGAANPVVPSNNGMALSTSSWGELSSRARSKLAAMYARESSSCRSLGLTEGSSARKFGNGKSTLIGTKWCT